MVKRVLVTGAANIGKAGVATIVYKWGQQFDKEKVVYDYLMQRGLPEKCYQRAIAEKGGKIFTMHEAGGFLSIIKWVSKVVKENTYKTIHINADSAYIAAAYIYAAKKGGIENIYVHSHCTQIDDNRKIIRFAKYIAHQLCIPYVKRNTAKYLACSKVAGQWMFGNISSGKKEYKTIYNGVEADRYYYDRDVRERKRKELGVGENYVIGNIGRLSFQKNQMYLVEMFKSFHALHPRSVLLIVGDGELKSELQAQIKSLGLEEAVMLLGQRNDVTELLSAFDVLVMPSRFEGLPVTMVEAQMASLPCVVSSNITKEAKFTDNVAFVDGWNKRDWIDSIEEIMDSSRPYHKETLNESIFNAPNASMELQSIFLETGE